MGSITESMQVFPQVNNFIITVFSFLMFVTASSSVGTPTPVISTKVDSLTDINATLVNEISPNTTASTEGNTTAFPIITSSAAAVPPLLVSDNKKFRKTYKGYEMT